MKLRAILTMALLALCACGARKSGPSVEGRPLREWVADAGSPDELTRSNAAWAAGRYLEKYGARNPDSESVALAAETARTALSDPSPKVRGVAADALAAAGAGAAGVADALGKALPDPEIVVRYKAAWALGNIGPQAVVALEDLEKALGDAVPEVRRKTIWALGRIGPGAAPAAPAIMHALGAEKGGEREESIRLAKAAIASMGAEAVPALAAALSDEPLDMRIFAAETCALLGPAAASAKDALIGAASRDSDMPGFSDPKYVTARVKAVEALGRIGAADEGALAALMGALLDRNMHVRLSAARAMAEIGPPAAPAADSLGIALGSGNAELAVESLRALARLGPAAAKVKQAIEKASADPDPEVSKLAKSLLNEIRRPG